MLTTNNITFLDLQFSSEEELDEVPLNEFEDSKGGILISAEMPMGEPGADDDSQQAAEAMVQLGNMGFYHQSEGEGSEALMFKGNSCIFIYLNKLFAIFIIEESIDVDPNYDPSDFLMSGLPLCKPEAVKENLDEHDVGIKIHDDLEVSESEDEENSANVAETQQQVQEEEDGGELWF